MTTVDRVAEMLGRLNLTSQESTAFILDDEEDGTLIARSGLWKGRSWPQTRCTSRRSGRCCCRRGVTPKVW
jgi:hypothetical protein